MMKFIGRPEVEGEHGRKKRTRMFFFPLQLFSLISVAPRKQSWWTQQDTTRVVTKVIPSTFSFLSPFLFSVCGGLAEKLLSQSRHCSIHYDTYCSSHRLLTLVPEKIRKALEGKPKTVTLSWGKSTREITIARENIFITHVSASTAEA